MHKAEDTRHHPDMPKRATPAKGILEAPSLKPKRTRSWPVGAQTTTCLALPDNSPVKDLLPQNQSSARTKGAGKHPQRGYSSHTQNGSAKKSISGTSKDKIISSPELEQISTKGARRSHNYLGNGITPELHSASTSSAAAHRECKVDPLEAQCAKLSICSDDANSSILLHSDGDTSSPEKAMSEDFQTEETSPEVVQDDPQGVEPLLVELMDDILGRLPMHEALQLRPELGTAFKNAIHRPAFRRNRPDAEGEFSPSYFMTDDKGDLHWHGFDTKLRKWTRLPSLNFAKEILPSPDPDLFKDYLVAGDGGLLCMNVGKATDREKLVICNPLTQQVKVLPRLNFPRHPVLMHLKVGDDGHYKVIVAGSAAIGTEELSLMTEEYDSRRGVWERPEGSDLPCPAFGLNEYQNGVYFQDAERELLMCVAIVDTRGRGVLVYDIMKKKWAQGPHVKQLHIPLVRSEPNVSHLATTQIVECGGSVFVFSEQECGRDVYFLIHKLVPEGSGDFTWDEVMKRKRSGGRGLLVYPEFTCVPVSEHELGIFNTVEHTIETVGLLNPTEVTPLQICSSTKGNRFHSLNPIGFVFKPSFKSVVCPRGRTLKVTEYCSECERDSDSTSTGVRMSDGRLTSTVKVESEVDTIIPTNVTISTNATGKPADQVPVPGPATSPVKVTGRRQKLCGTMAGEESGKRPNSWDGKLDVQLPPVAAK